MTIDQLIKLITRGHRTKHLHHFTDNRNIPSIAERGIFSRTALEAAGLTDVICGGNDWSHDQDDRKGVSDYVHLCFFPKHPMEYVAREEGRIQDSYFIRIKPEIIDRPGVLFCAGVSNAADAEFFDITQVEAKMDLDVMFKRTDWRDPAIQQRLQKVEKYEILVPKWVPKSYFVR